MKVKIRKSRLEDSRRIAHVHRRSIRGVCSNSYSQKIIDAWSGGTSAAGVRRAIKNPEVNNVIAIVDGVICGVAASVKNRIWLLYLHPSWIGKGIGEKLLQRLESDMRKKGIRKITLESSLNALNFYLRNGYQKVKKKTLTFRDGTRVPCVEMTKTI
ncbi:MAG: GNAT family N-acetyltransferase [Bdellovibrionota bacterium]